jgi:hypothetical protein
VDEPSSGGIWEYTIGVRVNTSPYLQKIKHICSHENYQ